MYTRTHNKLEKTETTPSIFSDHDMKLDIKENLKHESIKKCINESQIDQISNIETNGNGNTTCQNLWDAAKEVLRWNFNGYECLHQKRTEILKKQPNITLKEIGKERTGQRQHEEENDKDHDGSEARAGARVEWEVSLCFIICAVEHMKFVQFI